MNAQRILAALAVSAICACAFADDLFPPSWRTTPPGEGFTTFQSWEFGTDTNPSPPDVNLNHFGTPVLTVHGDFPYTVWKADDNGHQGVWRFEDWMTLDVPNNPPPLDFKEIWLQITYSAAEGHDPQVYTLPPESLVESVEKTQLDAYYWHETFRIIITPNPNSETIYIEPRDCSLYVDEIVLDTQCVPEPASLLLLAVSSLLLRRR